MFGQHRPELERKKGVPIPHHEGLLVLHQPTQPADAAGRPLNDGLVREGEAHSKTRRFLRGHLLHDVRQVVGVEPNFRDAGARQDGQGVAQQRLSEEWKGGLGPAVGKRLQPRPQPGGEHQRLH